MHVISITYFAGDGNDFGVFMNRELRRPVLGVGVAAKFIEFY